MDVSIIITSYNYDLYIERCIQSCLNQKGTKLKYEVIVIDDGSQDNTQTIVSNIRNECLSTYKIQNSGIEMASNFGFRQARGKFVVRVDADDMLNSNYLYTMERYVKLNYSFFYSNYKVINEHDTVVKNINLPAFSEKEIQARGDFLATGTLYSLDVLNELGGYCEMEKNTGLENYDFILKLIANGRQGLHINSNLFMYRKHQKSMSNKKRSQILENGNKLFQKYNLGKFGTNENHPYLDKKLS